MDVEPCIEGIARQNAGKVAQRHVDAQPDKAFAHVERLATVHVGDRVLTVAEQPCEGGQSERIGNDRRQDAALTQQVEQRYGNSKSHDRAPQGDAGQPLEAGGALQHGIFAVGQRLQQYGDTQGDEPPDVCPVAEGQLAQQRRHDQGEQCTSQTQPERPLAHHGNHA